LTAAAVGARQYFDSDAADRLALALDLMPDAPERLSAGGTLRWLWTYVERLRSNPDFSEAAGETVEVAVATRHLSLFRPATPGACWAANLVLVARAPASVLPLPPATLSRLLFRLDIDSDEQIEALAADWLRGVERADAGLWEVDRELARGLASLAGLSKNARAREAWALIVGSGGLSRIQLTRALGVSRGGAGLLVRQLVDAGLVCSNARGITVQSVPPKRAPPLSDAMASAASDVDEAMAGLDRLLARLPR
jgi:hypothetical protein